MQLQIKCDEVATDNKRLSENAAAIGNYLRCNPRMTQDSIQLQAIQQTQRSLIQLLLHL